MWKKIGVLTLSADWAGRKDYGVSGPAMQHGQDEDIEGKRRRRVNEEEEANEEEW